MEEGLFSDVIAITLQRYPTQNNFTFMYTKLADLYWATICWLLMRHFFTNICKMKQVNENANATILSDHDIFIETKHAEKF